MILILSHDHYDEPTNKVIDWLFFFNAKFIRYNGTDFNFDQNFTIDLEKLELLKNDHNALNIDDINVVWYRRWIQDGLKETDYQDFINLNLSEEEVLLIESYEKFLKTEVQFSRDGIFSLFDNKKWIPRIDIARKRISKIDVLIKAKRIGMNIPPTIVTTSKKQVLSFFENNGELITKPISEISPLIYKNATISMYTKAVGYEDIQKFPETFFTSIFQKKIDKCFEIRTFVFESEIYSMAIFSQNDDATNMDFRNYNRESPNRNVPFILPKDLEVKLLGLMEKLNLSTGSIDFILDKKGDFYFLEINPLGQLGMVSVGCNYYLEKKIAEHLIKIDTQINHE